MNSDITLFCDIDGVFTSARTGWHIWDTSAVQFINWVCKETGAKIVITSTWRFNHNREFFQKFFGENIHEDWRTLDFKNNSKISEIAREVLGKKIIRGDEIAEYLARHQEITKYLILDDDSDMLDWQKTSFRKTKSVDGLLYSDMLWICDYFNLPTYNADAANKELQTR